MAGLFFIGAGVVGREIANAFLEHKIALHLVDLDPQTLNAAVEYLSRFGYATGPAEHFPIGGSAVWLGPNGTHPQSVSHIDSGWIIESIAEKLTIKRDFLARASEHFGDRFIYATNTSTLRLSDLESACAVPENFCGLHFFMPIKGRDLVEVVRAPRTEAQVIDRCIKLANSIGKQALTVKDSPALVVNRILTPFINQGLLLLERGADHGKIREAANHFGMPFSPLEMVDIVGSRTAFDAGRVAWQAFPDRVETTPIIPGLVKAGLAGRATGAGFYEYDRHDGQIQSPDQLTVQAERVIAKYQREPCDWNLDAIELHLSIPMWIEAHCILGESIVNEPAEIELAMREGLGYRSAHGFFGYFESRGLESIEAYRARHAPQWKAFRIP